MPVFSTFLYCVITGISDLLTNAFFRYFNMIQFAAVMISAATFVLIHSQATVTSMRIVVLQYTFPVFTNCPGIL